eukprot:TRINITY_DN5427_c0_g6_i2.p1 TRINITY_DN5427_c0_g6~~TRINITY_DN5427_c0_g6_i2.p1  ORF type:complete len:744 (-),score=164.91 TRINITY_DN5427_c0_g6_i2:61-2292(-)
MSTAAGGAGEAAAGGGPEKVGERRSRPRRVTEILEEGDLGASRSTPAPGARRKRLLSHWQQYSSVSWRTDAQKDYDEHTSRVVARRSCCASFLHEATGWLVPALIGFLTATSGSLIERAVEVLGDLRFGFCSSNVLASSAKCGGGGWTTWAALAGAREESDAYYLGYLFYIVVCTFLAFASALLTWGFAPMARGSGIPEIKTILGGFNMPEVLDFNTLCIKIVGLSLSVASGLSCGKEGPLVHIACCWSNCCSKLFSRYANNEAKQRELLSTAAAAGVSVAFGAPLGGVLFSLEEVSTMFPSRTMVRSFFAAVVAALSLFWWNHALAGEAKLTMFEAPYTKPPGFAEYPVFVLIGVIGGVVGAGFVHWNIMVSKKRAPGTPFRRRVHIILEVVLIAVVTAITSWPLLWTRVLSNTTIRALFHPCSDASVNSGDKAHTYMLDLCDGGEPKMSAELGVALLVCGFLRYVQMIFTFGTGCPAGLFVPSLYVGAALGRVLGTYLRYFNADVYRFTDEVHPGIYAMIAAAAVLGGVCRVTISLVVIMFELTSSLQLVIPFMFAVLTAKWTGDLFTIGIYDYCIQIRKYPYLHEPDEVTFNTTAKDVMDEMVDSLHVEPGKMGRLLEFLCACPHGGYPLTVSEADRSLLGYIHTRQLRNYLEKENHDKGVVDISRFVDTTVLRVVPETPAVQLQNIFRHLGDSVIFVVELAELRGIITKKSFIVQMEVLHSGQDPCSSSASGLTEKLLP